MGNNRGLARRASQRGPSLLASLVLACIWLGLGDNGLVVTTYTLQSAGDIMNKLRCSLALVK